MKLRSSHGLATLALRDLGAAEVGITLDMHPVRVLGDDGSGELERGRRITDAAATDLPRAGAARAVSRGRSPGPAPAARAGRRRRPGDHLPALGLPRGELLLAGLPGEAIPPICATPLASSFRARTTAAPRPAKIAEAAGVIEPLLFRHFGSKAALFRETMVVPFTSFVNDFGRTWQAVIPEETDEDELAGLFVGQLYDVFVEHQGLVLTLLASEG